MKQKLIHAKIKFLAHLIFLFSSNKHTNKNDIHKLVSRKSELENTLIFYQHIENMYFCVHPCKFTNLCVHTT